MTDSGWNFQNGEEIASDQNIVTIDSSKSIANASSIPKWFAHYCYRFYSHSLGTARYVVYLFKQKKNSLVQLLWYITTYLIYIET